MKTFFLLDTLQISLIVAGSIILVVGLLLILYFTLFSSLRHRKQVSELSKKFEYLHALLFGQDSQYIKRIEQISTTNLLYAETHRAFAKRFKDIRDKSDSSAQASVNGLKDLLQERDYKGLKAAIPEARKIIDIFDEEVNALNSDLLAVIKPEEECRQRSVVLKEKLRRIKQDYYVKQADLSLVFDSFEHIFEKLDKKFKEYENLVDTADYEEAEKMLPNLEKIIDELGRALTELPNICVTIQSVIPDKLATLENAYQEMAKAEYPLHHLLVISGTEEIKMQLASITAQVQAFALNGVQAQLDAILSRIDEFLEAFDKEKDARVLFDSEVDEVYGIAQEADRKYIALQNALPSVKKMYVISDEENAKVDTIKNLINQAGATKRSLDTFVHSLTKQPYTLLVEKMDTLREESSEASQAIDEFYHYLISLKHDSESALATAKDYFARCKDAESMLRMMNLPAVTNKHLESIEKYYDLIDKIVSSLVTPINVAYINECVEALVSGCDETYLAIGNDYEMQLKAQASITYANRKRQHLGNVHSYLKGMEGIYWDGDFTRCYNETTKFIRDLREQE